MTTEKYLESDISNHAQQPNPGPTIIQQEKTDAGQRRVNLVWELTQALVAIMITLAIIYNAVNKIQSPSLENAFFVIITLYFVRTNHTKIGGVEPKPGNQQR